AREMSALSSRRRDPGSGGSLPGRAEALAPAVAAGAVLPAPAPGADAAPAAPATPATGPPIRPAPARAPPPAPPRAPAAPAGAAGAGWDRPARRPVIAARPDRDRAAERGEPDDAPPDPRSTGARGRPAAALPLLARRDARGERGPRPLLVGGRRIEVVARAG